MSLSFEDKATLINAGFLPYEVQQFDEAKTLDGQPQPPIDLGSPVWQRVLQSRRDWVNDKKAREWAQSEIEAEIMAYYRREKKRDPFSFLKAEYRPPAKKDFWESVRAREQHKIKAELKGYFK